MKKGSYIKSTSGKRQIDYTLLYVLTERGIYENYKRISRGDLKRIEALVGDVDSEKKAASRIFLCVITRLDPDQDAQNEPVGQCKSKNKWV
jgi:hypothetical protein